VGRLARWCDVNACALLVVAGADALDDAASAKALAFVTGMGEREEVNSAQGELVMLVTANRVLLHCPAAHWVQIQHTVEQSGVPHDVFTPAAHVAAAGEAALDFKLEACRALIAHAAAASLPVLAGARPLAGAAFTWPILRAVFCAAPPPLPPPFAPAATAAAAASLHQLLRSMLDADLDADHPLSASARGLEARWAALFRCLDRAAEEESLLSLTEKRLESALCDAPQPSGRAPTALPPPPAPLLLLGETRVRLGVRSRDESGKRYPGHTAGLDRSAALHLVARAVDHNTGLAVARTLFFSNGRPPHHWQHRVFPDGEVLEPLVEDDVGEVEYSGRTARLLQLYCALVAAARDIAAAAAAACPAELSDADALRILTGRLASDARAGPGSDASRASARIWRGLLRDSAAAPGAAAAPLHAEPRRGLSAEAKRAEAAVQAAAAAEAAAEAEARGAAAAGAAAAVGEGAPLEWLLHSVCVRLETDEGALVFELPLVLDGRGGWRSVVRVPELSCWPATGTEAAEARLVRHAVQTNLVCANPASAVERLRAGEHAQLQALVAEPLEGCVLLLDSAWLPAVRGSLRLFAGGVAFDSARFGPLVLPFRIHLDAVTAFNLGGHGAGALILHQKKDDHAYGPLALLPERCFGGEPVALTLAIAVPCRGPLHHALQEKAWPYWARLFAECGVDVRVTQECPGWVRAAMRASDGVL